MTDQRAYIEMLAKHLPPSASGLRLVDVDGACGAVLADLRPDLAIRATGNDAAAWGLAADSVDAVVAYDHQPNDLFLSAACTALRPGGRLIMVNPDDAVSEAMVTLLAAAGYVRILVEPALAGESGVLLRGEKPHTTANTLQRVRDVAERDDTFADLSTYKGRFVHLLVFQTPNKPVWTLQPDEQITWEALAVNAENRSVLLAFSSLPQAVSFMQAAVVAGLMQGVNKLPKFSRETAQAWAFPVLLNPSPDVLHAGAQRIAIDPQSAETPDE